MSSLAAARADNFYFPPEYDGKKHGSLNKYNNSHGALGKRANRLADEGILVIRFEMPFDIWCGGCGHLIAKGVRFNADKKQIGNYFSTKIWSFKMRAPCCSAEIEVQTDPKNCEYNVVTGGRRKKEDYKAEDAQVIELLSQEHRDRLRSDPLFRMEHQAAAKSHQEEENKRTLLMLNDAQKMKEDYELNRDLRRKMRQARNEEQSLDSRRAALGLPDTIRLLPEHPEDIERARMQAEAGFGPGSSARKDGSTEARRERILSQSIFSGSAAERRDKAAQATTRPPQPATRAGKHGVQVTSLKAQHKSGSGVRGTSAHVAGAGILSHRSLKEKAKKLMAMGVKL